MSDVNPYFEESPELREVREKIAELMKQIAVPHWIIPSDAGDAITRAMNEDYRCMAKLTRFGDDEQTPAIEPRACYHCDSHDRVEDAGSVALCAGCREAL